MSDTCRGCGAPVLWTITHDGKRAPITAEPSQAGTVLVFRQGDGVQSRTFAGEVLAGLRAAGVPLRLNHFADCPQAGSFR